MDVRKKQDSVLFASLLLLLPTALSAALSLWETQNKNRVLLLVSAACAAVAYVAACGLIIALRLRRTALLLSMMMLLHILFFAVSFVIEEGLLSGEKWQWAVCCLLGAPIKIVQTGIAAWMGWQQGLPSATAGAAAMLSILLFLLLTAILAFWAYKAFGRKEKKTPCRSKK